MLQRHGEIQVVASGNINEIFEPFTVFHRQRWGHHTYKPDRQKAFLQALSEQKQLTTGGLLLIVDGSTIACTIDVIANNRAYNLQMGFVDKYDKKISLGTLMLGYAIEHYCLQPQLQTYDLLAGPGKHTNYKAHLAPVGCRLETLQLIRAKHLKLMYRSKDILFSIKHRLAGRT